MEAITNKKKQTKAIFKGKQILLSELDYSQEYGMRNIFWAGRSNCNPPNDLFNMTMKTMLDPPATFFCDTN